MRSLEETAPDTTRILLTGFAELQTAIEAVNRGHIFRFLTKPCPTDMLRTSLAVGVEQYRLRQNQRDLLEKTLHGSVKVLADVLALINPKAFGKTARLRKIVAALAELLHLPDAWQLDVAAMLAMVGYVSVPEHVVNKLEREIRLNIDEEAMVKRHPQVGHELLAGIPRLEAVAEMVLYQRRRFDGWDDTGLKLSGKAIPHGARLLKIASDYDEAMQRGQGPRAAYLELEGRASWYDPELLAALKIIVADIQPGDVQRITLRDLRAGMVLRAGLSNRYGARLIPDDTEVTPALLSRIRNMAERGMIAEPFEVFILPSIVGELAAEIPVTAGA